MPKWSDVEDAKLLAAILRNCEVNYKDKADTLAESLGGDYTGGAVYQHLNKIKRGAAGALGSAGGDSTPKGSATPKKRARKPKDKDADIGGGSDDDAEEPATPSRKKMKNSGGSAKKSKGKANSVNDDSEEEYEKDFTKKEDTKIKVENFPGFEDGGGDEGEEYV